MESPATRACNSQLYCLVICDTRVAVLAILRSNDRGAASNNSGSDSRHRDGTICAVAASVRIKYRPTDPHFDKRQRFFRRRRCLSPDSEISATDSTDFTDFEEVIGDDRTYFFSAKLRLSLIVTHCRARRADRRLYIRGGVAAQGALSGSPRSALASRTNRSSGAGEAGPRTGSQTG